MNAVIVALLAAATASASVLDPRFPRQEQPSFPAARPAAPASASIEVLGSVESVAGEAVAVPPGPLPPSNALLPPPPEPELGFVDSVFGDGTQSRILDSVYRWVSGKVRENPGCVERFICETFRTGESMEGVPYILMKISNNAVAYTVAELFDTSINVKEITRAARYGRTVGSCHTMKCDVLDGQLRTLGDYFEAVEEFLSSMVNSVMDSINLG